MTTKRAICLLVAVLAAALPGVAAHAGPQRAVLFVGDSGDGTIDMFDATTYAPLGSFSAIPDGSTPQDPVQALAYGPLTSKVGINYVQDIQLSPDGRTLYVSRGYLGDIVAIDLATHQIEWRTQIQSLRADHAELSPDGTRLFVSALTSDVVEVIDTTTHEPVGAIPAGDFPHTLGFSPDGSVVYGGSLGINPLDTATSQTPPTDGRHWLEAINPQTMTLEGVPCMLDEGIRPFVVTQDGSTMYLQLSYYNGVVKYDPHTCTTLAKLALPLEGPGLTTAPHDYPNQAAQHGITLSGDEQWLCSAGTIDDYAALIRVSDFSLSKIVPVGQEPGYAVTSPDGNDCIVSSRGPTANNVSVISFATQQVTHVLPTGLHPQVELIGSVASDVFA
jgi:YVTN family beta-propeller protein